MVYWVASCLQVISIYLLTYLLTYSLTGDVDERVADEWRQPQVFINVAMDT